MNQIKALLGVRLRKEEGLICTRWSVGHVSNTWQSLHVCVCMSAFVSYVASWCMCVCIWVCSYIWTCVWIHTHVYVCVCLCAFLVVPMCARVCCVPYVCLCAHLCSRTFLCVCGLSHVCPCVSCVFPCIYICPCVYECAHSVCPCVGNVPMCLCVCHCTCVYILLVHGMGEKTGWEGEVSVERCTQSLAQRVKVLYTRLGLHPVDPDRFQTRKCYG